NRQTPQRSRTTPTIEGFMSRQTRPYLCPLAYLPADSKIPHPQAAIERTGYIVPPDIQATFTGIIQELDQFNQLIKHHIIAAHESSAGLARLGQVMACAHSRLEPEWSAIEQANNFDTSACALREALLSEPPDLMVGHIAFDRFFHIVRVPSLTIAGF